MPIRLIILVIHVCLPAVGRDILSQVGDDMIIATIRNKYIFARFGNIHPNVALTQERITHISSRHPNDYNTMHGFIQHAIEAPAVILEDRKKPMTAMFIGKTDTAHVNVVVRLCLAEKEDGRSFVVTMYAIGEKRLARLIRSCPVLYKDANVCYNEDEPK